MGILQRFSDIMSANINSLLSGAEEKNAGKLLEKYLADARANLEELKSETSAIIADEMAAARRVAANNEEIAKYDRYAEQAVLAGNDDDARKFLDAKSQLVAKKAELEAAYETAKSNSDKMRQMTRKLMEDIASAEGKMVELRAKLTVAEHKEKMDDLMHKVAGRTDMSGFENMMEAVQKRIDSVDAKVALNEELADKMDIKKLEENFAQSSAALPDGKGLCIRMSGGVAWYPEDALDLDTLKKYADFAMYEVKHSTKGEIREFDMERYRAGVYAMEQRSDFEKLIRERRVDYDFQPIVSAHDGHVVAYEALMRPQLPTLRSPLTVMQLASEMGRMYDIEKLTLFRACECYEELKAAGKLDADALIFVNSIASVSLSDEDWASYCEAHSATLPKLVVEITEEEEMNERELERKRDFLGSPGAFALDDYGSGYSNGNSLLTVAPKYVKVDIAIIRGIDTDADKQQFLKTLIDYARPRGIYVLAEGVETLSELRKVLEMGVDLLQGYCLACPAAEPVAIDEKAVQVIREAAQKRIEQEEAWS